MTDGRGGPNREKHDFKHPSIWYLFCCEACDVLKRSHNIHDFSVLDSERHLPKLRNRVPARSARLVSRDCFKYPGHFDAFPCSPFHSLARMPRITSHLSLVTPRPLLAFPPTLTSYCLAVFQFGLFLWVHLHNPICLNLALLAITRDLVALPCKPNFR